MGSSSNSEGVALPGAVKKLEQVVLRELRDLMSELFERADDLFFEFAEKVKIDADRNKYFDAMRELRLQRKGIEQRFLKVVDHRFNQLPDPASELNRDFLSNTPSTESLSLVNHEELEQNVALEGMVSKARNKHANSLFQFNTRLDALVLNVTISEKNSPLDPRQLCDAFRLAIKNLQCDIKSLLIVFKLFEKWVLERLDKPLDTCNYLLAKAGVLPDLKGTPSSMPKKADTSGAAAKPPAATKPAEILPQDVANYLHALLAATRQAPMLAAMPGFSSAPIGSGVSNAKDLNQSQLLGVLSEVQKIMPRGQDVLQGPAVLSRLNVRNTLDNVFAKRETSYGPERVSQTDTDVINLVGMLFDFILDDRNLPIRVKALIGRLQIPILKVAVKDSTFFSVGRHPARRLLNELAHAGIGLPDKVDDLSKDVVFHKIQSIVQVILEKFTDDLSMFDPLLTDFVEFMSSDSRRADLVAQRTKSAEEGRALTEHARAVVAGAIERKLKDKRLPELLVRFVHEPWANVLFRIHIKQGEASKAWIAALQTVDLLIQSVTPPSSPEEKSALYNGLPVLQKRLREGMESISYNAFAVNEFVTNLEEIQLQVLRGETPDHLKEASSDPAEQLLAAIKEDIDARGAEPAIDSSGHASLMAPKIKRIDQAKGFATSPKVDEPVLPPMADDDEHLVHARHLGIGAWVEFIDEQNVKIRCKLAARIKTTDRMVFVNRAGMKVRDCATLSVAHELMTGQMVVLDDSLLFDRALQSVIGSLRRVRETTAAS